MTDTTTTTTGLSSGTVTPNATVSPVVSINNLITNPKSVAGWGGLLVSLGALLETNAGDTWEGWLVSVGTLVTSALTIILPTVIKH